MVINTKKTKEMLIVQPATSVATWWATCRTCYKLQVAGSQRVCNGMNMCHRCVHSASIFLHFLQQLKREAMSSDDLLYYYYNSVVRPVTDECACVVWHTSLTQEQTKHLQSLFRSAWWNYIRHQQWRPTESTGHSASLAEKREWLTKRIFCDMSNKTNTLHELYFWQSEIAMSLTNLGTRSYIRCPGDTLHKYFIIA